MYHTALKEVIFGDLGFASPHRSVPENDLQLGEMHSHPYLRFTVLFRRELSAPQSETHPSREAV